MSMFNLNVVTTLSMRKFEICGVYFFTQISVKFGTQKSILILFDLYASETEGKRLFCFELKTL